MKITKEHILNLLGLLDKHGLVNGAGSSPEEFCIQQAVNRVIHNDLYGQYGDSPTMDCLNDGIRSLGIQMNDCIGSVMGNKERAAALKRFAVAELGSNKINATTFFRMLAEKLDIDKDCDPDEMLDDYLVISTPGETRASKFKVFADTAADILKELGTQGSQFLDLVDEPNKKKQRKEACKLGNQLYAARMAEFGTASCSITPRQQQ